MRALRLASSLGAVLLIGCSHGGSHGFTGTTSLPSTATPAPVATAALATGEEDGRPLVLVHGLNGKPADWDRMMDGLGPGRDVFRQAFADDLAAVASGSVRRSSIWAIGYYRRRATDPDYMNGQGSIGGCPVPRTDQAAGSYPYAWVDNVNDCVERILAATGAQQVDMVGCSLGGVVARAYIKWRSGRGPNGASRVRRFLVLESPSRGLNDVEGVMLSLDRLPFQRWGEIAELVRDYPVWGGRSYIEELNDGWDAWVSSHGVTYGNVYGFGLGEINARTFQDAVTCLQGYISGNPGTPAPPLPGPGGVPAAQALTPGLGLTPTSSWVAIQQALIFLDPSRLDLLGNVNEILGQDADGFVRVGSSSASAGPEFPSCLFDSRFRGVHLDRGQPDETIQYCTNTREVLRRFLIEGELPSAKLVSASLSVVPAGGFAPWLLLDYELAGDGFSVQVVTEDQSLYNLRLGVGIIPAAPTVYGAPTFPGHHRIRLDGEPAGSRVAKIYFYDTSGVLAEVGPLVLNVPQAQAGPELAPQTTFVNGAAPGTEAILSVAANSPNAELAWRLGASGTVTPWTRTNAIPLSNLATGTYELTVWSRNADNFAGELVEDRDPLVLGVRVDGAGTIFVRQ
jgi:pimeloyl-ACP methyl ester carboxylesterase